MMKTIHTPDAPGAIGPYSQGYEANGFVFTSGQIAIIPETGEIAKGIEEQAARCCKNVGAILKAAGCGFENVIKTTCFLADMDDFAAFNEIYAAYFLPPYSAIRAERLPDDIPPAICFRLFSLPSSLPALPLF